MRTEFKTTRALASGTVVLALAACGGGSSDAPADTPTDAPTATTTNVTTRVIDGPIRNALVCVDKNASGRCDEGELSGRTEANGSVTLAVPNDDVGKYPTVAEVGLDAVDADHGVVSVPFTLSTPANQPAVASPLTTLVQTTIASTGASAAEAARSVQDATGIAASVYADYIASPPPDGGSNPATIARLLVLATQAQTRAVASAVNATALDGRTITQPDLDKAVQRQVLALLPEIVAAAGETAVANATTPAARETAVQAAASALVASQGLTVASVATAVGVINQESAVAPASTPADSLLLNTLTYTDANNYTLRTLGGTAAQNTADASNNVRFIERRQRKVSGVLASWGSGGSPQRNSDLSWNGSAWVGCPINTENLASVRDARGISTYTYCNSRETGRSSRSAFDIAGRTLAAVYQQIRDAGYTNVSIANPAALGAATFPSGSQLLVQTVTPLTSAYAYHPAGAENPAGFSNVVQQYSAAVTGGGIAASQAAGTACNSAETTGNGTSSTTLESMIAAKTGTPCVFGPGTFTYAGTVYSSGDRNEWWGNSTLGLGTLGSAPVGSGTAPGYYTGNTLLRVAFSGSGANAVTYYACRQRFNNGSTRNCDRIGTGSYAIQTVGDARVLTYTNVPAQAGPLTFNAAIVERGGLVYFGYQSKLNATSTARFNTTATVALMAQLGLAPIDPATPLALTSASYQGTWDLRMAGTAVSPTNGTTVFVNANGTTSCQDRADGSNGACTLTITNPATGAFTFSDASSTAAGTFAFMAGTVGGTYNDPTATPVTGAFVGGRR